jgi:protein-tyrosine-phosphatase
MHQTSSSQVKSERDIPPISSVSDLEPLDIDTPPERYLSPGKPSSQSTPRDVAHTHHSTTPTISSDRRRKSVIQSPSKQPSGTLDRHQQQSTNQQSTPKKQSPSIFRWLTGTTRPDSIESEAEQLLKTQADEINQLTKLLREKADAIKSMSENHMKDKEHQQQRFRDEWQHREKEIQQHYQQIGSQKNDTIQSLQVQVQELASHRNKIQEKYNTLIRRQQEESFKQMETGRWLPREESRVLADFERIRTQMRTWAKSAAVKNIAAIQDVEEEQHASLMASLSRVAVVENNQLPRGLSTPKGPSLLLNALLAHDVYTSLFRSPFFFLNDDLEHGPTGDGLDDSLNKIYGLALACKWEASSDGDYLLNISANVEDAHIWRSQTLRLLLPPLRAGNTDGEKGLHQWTEGMIAKVAELHASRFAASSARYLIDTNTANIKKLNSIYQEAASVSYMLWTRKTAMRLVTLSDMGSPNFDVDDSRLKPHTMVHPDDHDDKLKGRQITLIVHPLLRVYGTDEGRDYDNARVWVPAEVWFDTR